MLSHFTNFLRKDDGAVSVDWVVLTSATVGLGIATLAVVSGGVGDLSGETARNLGRPFIQTAFLTPDSFSNGPGGWLGIGTSNVVGFGDILGPLQGDPAGTEQVWQVFDIPGGAMEVHFSFDMLSMDSIDGGLIDRGWGAEEGPVLYLDGQEIARARSSSGNLSWTYSDIPGVTIESEVIQSGTNIGGPAHTQERWKDGINQVSIKFDEPEYQVRLGLGMKADQGINDESIGIDNFTFQAM